MLFKRQKTTSGRSSVLKGQRLRRRMDSKAQEGSPQSHTTPVVQWTMGFLAFFLLSFSAYSTWSLFHQKQGRFAESLGLWPRELNIIVESGDDTVLNESTLKTIYGVASKELSGSRGFAIENLVGALEAIGTLENIHVIRPQIKTIVIHANERRPFLLVRVGEKTRFLTRDGTVYGEFRDTENAPTPVKLLSVVNGVFDEHQGNRLFDHSLRLITSPEEKSILLQAISLSTIVANNNLSISGVSYQKFRGYSIKLKDETDVVLGLYPFEHKLEKLKSIQLRLSARGVAASRIELDYDGKAFIKEKKL